MGICMALYRENDDSEVGELDYRKLVCSVYPSAKCWDTSLFNRCKSMLPSEFETHSFLIIHSEANNIMNAIITARHQTENEAWKQAWIIIQTKMLNKLEEK